MTCLLHRLYITSCSPLTNRKTCLKKAKFSQKIIPKNIPNNPVLPLKKTCLKKPWGGIVGGFLCCWEKRSHRAPLHFLRFLEQILRIHEIGPCHGSAVDILHGKKHVELNQSHFCLNFPQRTRDDLNFSMSENATELEETAVLLKLDSLPLL